MYPLPCDTTEICRLNDMHYMFWVHKDNRNIIAPIDPAPQQILDLGTGCGRWVCEVAVEQPNARVIGLDLVPADPLEEVAGNCEFNVADFNDGLVKLYGIDSMDLVHSR